MKTSANCNDICKDCRHFAVSISECIFHHIKVYSFTNACENINEPMYIENNDKESSNISIYTQARNRHIKSRTNGRQK